MKKSMFLLAIAAMCVCTWAATGVAIARPALSRPKTVAPLDPITVPRMLNYQGKLLDSAGLAVVDTVFALRFGLYTVPTGGVAFWTENQMARTKAGLYSVLLGAVTAIDSFPAAGICYLGMKVGADPEMTPRIRIVGAPYAYLAGKANNANYATQAGATDSAGVSAMSDNSARLQGKDTTGFVCTGEANSITTAMIVNGTIVTADVAPNFKAPYSDTADYARTSQDVDSVRIAANAWALQGNDAAYFIHTDQVDGVSSAMLQNSAVTSAKIEDGTIVRANVASNFKAPYSDTADYALSAPVSDSTRIAANAYLLDGKSASAFAAVDHTHPFVDSARIAVSTYNSDKLQGNDAAYFIHTDQANSITSGMITNGTIATADAASGFKAPYSDTADYARSAPAVDSTRVAANAYLLDGNAASAFAAVDHTHPFVDSARIAVSTYNSEKLQGNDAAYFIHTDQANSVTSGMIGDGTVLRTNVAGAFKAPYADTADYAREAPAVDSTRVAANAYLLDGNAASAFAAVDHTHPFVDSARIAVSAYNSEELQGNDADYFIHTDQANSVTSGMITNGTIATADAASGFKAPYSDTADYARSAPAVDSTRVAANAYLLDGNAASAFAAVSHTHPFVDSARIAVSTYNSDRLQGNDAAYFIHADQANSVSNAMLQNSAVTSAKIENGTIVRANVAGAFKAPYADTADYAREAPAVDSTRVAANAYLLDGNAASAFALVDHTHPFVDSARIAVSTHNSEKLQGNDADYFIHTDQANSVTSAMIGDGTILRTNVAAAFQAPYADTADYARVAPAVDSTRVAANAYLLDGNAASAFALVDHTHPFVDSARIAVSTYNSDKLQGNDAAYFIHADQANSVTSAMIGDGTILRTNVASDFKAPYSDTADFVRSAPPSGYLVRTSRGPVTLYSQASPENWFEDFGSGTLAAGKTHIDFDALFMQTVTISAQYPVKVFLQQTSGTPANLVVVKGSTGFDVVGPDAGDITFDYRVVARHRGFETARLAAAPIGYTDATLYPDPNDPQIPAAIRAQRAAPAKLSVPTGKLAQSAPSESK